MAAEQHRHTERERRVVAATVEVYRAWRDLAQHEGEGHPSHTRDVADAVHDIQRILAIRLARRVEPDIWGRDPFVAASQPPPPPPPPMGVE